MKPLNLLILLTLTSFYMLVYSISIYEIGYPSIADLHLHMLPINGWLSGANPLTTQSMFINPFPYPPAFHLTIVLFSKLFNTDPINIFNVIQIFAFSTILLLFYSIVKEFKDEYTATLSVCLLVASFSFWDWSNQPIPTGFDFLLLPLVIYAYLKDRNYFFVFGGVFLIYNHLFYGASLVAGFFINAYFYNKQKLPYCLMILIMSVPLAAVYIPHLHPLLTFKDSSGQRFMANNYFFWNIAYFGYYLAPIAIGGLLWTLQKKKDELERLLLSLIAGLIPLTIMVSNRASTFLVPPLAILGAIMLKDVASNEKERTIILLVSFFVALLYFFAEFSLFGFDSYESARLRQILFTH